MTRALLRRRYVVAAAAVALMLVLFGITLATSTSAVLAAIVYAPLVTLVGVDAGMAAGAAAGGLAGGIWLAGAHADGMHPTAGQAVTRFVVLCILGLGSAIVGDLLRTSESRRARTVARQRALIDATPDGMCLTDLRGNVLISNEPIVRMSEELGMVGHGPVHEQLLSIADRLTEPERFRKRMLELADAPGEASIDEFEFRDTGRVFRGFTSPVELRGGRSIGRIWTLREVTADKEIERMRDAFVATVSHELRTPLTSISGFVEMLQDEEHGLGESARAYIDVIGRSAERLHQLVEDLLLVAQIEARRVDLRREPVDLAAVAASSLALLRPSADERGIVLELDADGAPAVLGDGRRLAQVLDNLLSNAVKFSREGGSVRVEITQTDGAVRLVVADTGIGIPADELGQVFSRFFRARTAHDLAVPGTGLGLAITHALVEQHGGTIALESHEGEGTRVSLTLPAA